MEQNKVIGFLYLIAMAVIFSHFKVFISYVEQHTLIREANSSGLISELESVKNMNYSYPTLSATSVPLASLLAGYYSKDSLWEDAIKLYHIGKKHNPYLMFSDFNLGFLYRNIYQKDSSLYYAKKAFFSQPNHPNHFQLLLSEYDFTAKDSTLIDSLFSLIKTRESNVIENYFVAGLNNEILTSKMYDTARKVNKVTASEHLNNLASSVLYGRENVAISIEYTNIGAQLFDEGRLYEAKDYFLKALDYFQYYPIALINMGIINNKLKLYDESNKYLDLYQKNKWDKDSDGKAFFIKGLNYVKLEQNEKACNYFTKSILKGYKDAFRAKKSLCK